MNGIAPVCPVSRSQVPANMPGIQLPVVPLANDLPSLIAAVNGLRNLLQNAIGPGLPHNLLLGPIGSPLGAIRIGQVNWREINRVTEQDRIYHHDAKGVQDTSMFVDVQRITQVTFQYSTGDAEKFDWQYQTSGQS